MKKYKLVRDGVFDKTWMELYRHEGEIVFWYSDDDSPYNWEDGDGWGGDFMGNLPCGCCSCCGCDCYYYDLEDDDE